MQTQLRSAFQYIDVHLYTKIKPDPIRLFNSFLLERAQQDRYKFIHRRLLLLDYLDLINRFLLLGLQEIND